MDESGTSLYGGEVPDYLPFYFNTRIYIIKSFQNVYDSGGSFLFRGPVIMRYPQYL